MRLAPDIGTCTQLTYPFTKKPAAIANGMRDRKLQRALMTFFKPKNDFHVHEALVNAGRADLIGNGCDTSISAEREAGQPGTTPDDGLPAG